MTATQVDWRLHVHGGVGHAFARRGSEAMGVPGFAYNKAADERSWSAMMELFEQTIGSP